MISSNKLARLRKQKGDMDPEVLTEMRHLGGIYIMGGRYDKAEELLSHAAHNFEIQHGIHSHDTTESYYSLGRLYRAMGDSERARDTFEKCMRIREAPHVAGMSDRLAKYAVALGGIHLLLGEVDKAQHLLLLASQQDGIDKDNMIECLTQLAFVYTIHADYYNAIDCMQRKIALHRAILQGGTLNGIRMSSLYNLADCMGAYADIVALYRKAGNLSGADLTYKEGLSFWTEIQSRIAQTGFKMPPIAQLAKLHAVRGELDKACLLYERVLQHDIESYGLAHPITIRTMESLASTYLSKGSASLSPKQQARVLDLAIDAKTAKEELSSLIFSFTTERQRLAFQKTLRPYDLLATLESAPALAEAILRMKGAVLDSLLDEQEILRRGGDNDPSVAPLLAKARDLKQEIIRLTLASSKDGALTTLKQEAESVEERLVKAVPRFARRHSALRTEIAAVQHNLLKGTVLVELIRYDKWERDGESSPSYGAILITPNGPPQWAALGDAQKTDAMVLKYKHFVRGGVDADEGIFLVREMAARIWSPIQQCLPSDTTEIIICPDGELSFISFAGLFLENGETLGETYGFSYVASGRDLIRDSRSSESRMVSLFGNPDFSSVSSSSVSSNQAILTCLSQFRVAGFGALALTDLPGSARECQALATLATDRGYKPHTYLGRDAREPTLFRQDRPFVLHLATHGFFFSAEDTLSSPTSLWRERGLKVVASSSDVKQISQDMLFPPLAIQNPMLRSGLALAGAQASFDALKRGGSLDSRHDGIVLAGEIAMLQLDGTRLVTLSACDTGMGEARHGEGVLGLRRAFVQTGTQAILLTLWPVADEETASFMQEFYGIFLSTGNLRNAFHQTQRSWLSRVRKEKGIVPSLRLAAPFILNLCTRQDRENGPNKVPEDTARRLADPQH